MCKLLKICLLSAAIACCGGCGGETAISSVPAQPIIVDHIEVVDYLVDRYEMPNATSLDAQLLEEYIQIDPKLVEDFYGFFSLEEGYPDCIIYIEVVKKEEESVEAQLEKRRSFLETSLEKKKDWQYEKANKGEIFVYDQDLYLIIGGRSDVDVATEMAEMMAFLRESYAP